MKQILNNKYLSLIVRLIIGFVFIYAGTGKILDPQTFAKEIYNYHILPDIFVNILALIMPWLELIVGLFLIAGVRIKASAALTSIMMLVFIIAVFSAMIRGLNINCGCFSDKITLVGWGKIIEDTIYLIGCLYIFYFPVRAFTIEESSSEQGSLS